MGDLLYNLIILAVGAFSVIVGFRWGFTGQVCSVLGMAFGAVSARVFCMPVQSFIQGNFPFIDSLPFPGFATQVMAASGIYVFVYVIFGIFTGILRSALKIFGIGMFNRIVGSVFCLFKNLLFLSIVYNLILCFDPDSSLLRYARAQDGNMVEEVLVMTGAILGCESVREFAHEVQLREAKKISYNFKKYKGVIITDRFPELQEALTAEMIIGNPEIKITNQEYISVKS